MPKIICADDDKLISQSLVEAFTAAGFEVTATFDGEETVTKVKEGKPDVLLLDIMMPKLDGLGVAWELKADATTADLPIVMLTNLSDSETVSKIMEAGITDYLLKSEQTIDQIVAKVQEVLNRNTKPQQ